ncbi:MAG: hypothetical protein ACJAYB_000001, partial [Psychromonas sp.]
MIAQVDQPAAGAGALDADNTNVIVGAVVSVKFKSSGLLAPIFLDDAGSTPIAQPGAVANGSGVFAFYIAPGTYIITTNGVDTEFGSEQRAGQKVIDPAIDLALSLSDVDIYESVLYTLAADAAITLPVPGSDGIQLTVINSILSVLATVNYIATFPNSTSTQGDHSIAPGNSIIFHSSGLKWIAASSAQIKAPLILTSTSVEDDDPIITINSNAETVKAQINGHGDISHAGQYITTTGADLLVASGAITISSSAHVIDHAGTGTAQLHTISNCKEGARVLLSISNSDRPITLVKTMGNLDLGSTFTLDNVRSKVELFCKNGKLSILNIYIEQPISLLYSGDYWSLTDKSSSMTITDQNTNSQRSESGGSVVDGRGSVDHRGDKRFIEFICTSTDTGINFTPGLISRAGTVYGALSSNETVLLQLNAPSSIVARTVLSGTVSAGTLGGEILNQTQVIGIEVDLLVGTIALYIDGLLAQTITANDFAAAIYPLSRMISTGSPAGTGDTKLLLTENDFVFGPSNAEFLPWGKLSVEHMNPVDISVAAKISNLDRSLLSDGGLLSGRGAVARTGGKWYIEYRVDSGGVSNTDIKLGFANTTFTLTANTPSGQYIIVSDQIESSTSTTTGTNALTTPMPSPALINDIISLEVNLDLGDFFVYVNNVLFGSFTGHGAITSPMVPYMILNNGATARLLVNSTEQNYIPTQLGFLTWNDQADFTPSLIHWNAAEKSLDLSVFSQNKIVRWLGTSGPFVEIRGIIEHLDGKRFIEFSCSSSNQPVKFYCGVISKTTVNYGSLFSLEPYNAQSNDFSHLGIKTPTSGSISTGSHNSARQTNQTTILGLEIDLDTGSAIGYINGVATGQLTAGNYPIKMLPFLRFAGGGNTGVAECKLLVETSEFIHGPQTTGYLPWGQTSTEHFNPLDISTQATISNLDRIIQSTGSLSNVRGLIARAGGKWYIEYRIDASGVSDTDTKIGLAESGFNIELSAPTGQFVYVSNAIESSTSTLTGSGALTTAFPSPAAVDDIIGLEIDLDLGDYFVYVNNVLIGSHSGRGAITQPMLPWVSLNNSAKVRLLVNSTEQTYAPTQAGYTSWNDTPAANVAPVANAGVDQGVITGGLVTLDGSGSSDPDAGDVITYLW